MTAHCVNVKVGFPGATRSSVRDVRREPVDHRCKGSAVALVRKVGVDLLLNFHIISHIICLFVVYNVLFILVQIAILI